MDNPATDKPKILEQSADSFSVRCVRCRETATFATSLELGSHMYNGMEVSAGFICPPCAFILKDVRSAILTQADADAYAAAVGEINQHHADNPLPKAELTALTLVNKEEVH